MTDNAIEAYLNSIDNAKTYQAMRDGLFSCFILLVDQDGLTIEHMMVTPWWNWLNQENVTMIRSRLREQYSISTCNLRLAALRGYWEMCWRKGLIDRDRYMKLEIPDFKGETAQVGRMIGFMEIKALLDVCKSQGNIGLRNAACIVLAYQCGLRREEISNLPLTAYNPETGEIKVNGKGGKIRNVYVSGNTKEILDEYLRIRGDAPHQLFLSFDAHGNIRQGSHFGIQGMHDMLKSLISAAGLKNLTWHDFRRTFISTLLDKGVDLVQVSQVAGHSHVEQTKRYDRRPEAARKDIFSLIDI